MYAVKNILTDVLQHAGVEDVAFMVGMDEATVEAFLDDNESIQVGPYTVFRDH